MSPGLPVAVRDLCGQVRSRLSFVQEALSLGGPDQQLGFSPQAVNGLCLILMDCEAAVEEAERLMT